MSKKEILEGAIKKAIANGWSRMSKHGRLEFIDGYDGKWLQWSTRNVVYEIANTQEQLIYNHNFAKALWGEKTEMLHDPLNDVNIGFGPAYKQYLMEMVIAKDPIAYLAKSIGLENYNKSDSAKGVL